MPPGSPNPDPVSVQKMTFSHSFSDLEVVTKHNITCLHKTEIIIAEIKPQQKDFLNSHFKLSLLYIWN